MIRVDTFSYHTSVFYLYWSSGLGSVGHGAEQSAHVGQVTKIGKL